MRVYAVDEGGRANLLSATRYPNLLFSYNPANPLGPPYQAARLFLDSGAYGAWARGVTIDVDLYADWALEQSRRPDVVVANLDVIPGAPGRAPTTTERRHAVLEGVTNAMRLRARGLPVVEVYHRYEPLEVLAGICDRRQPDELIALGGLVGGRDTGRKIRFCDRAFRYLIDRYGKDALPPVHGFGVGPDSRLGNRYYWYSIDATTWISTRKFGEVIGADGRPRGHRDGVDWRQSSLAVLDRWKRYEVAGEQMLQDAGVRFDLTPA